MADVSTWAGNFEIGSHLIWMAWRADVIEMAVAILPAEASLRIKFGDMQRNRDLTKQSLATGLHDLPVV